MLTPMVTFIVPTIGRQTLAATIESLEAQTVPDWKAIIVFDGIKAPAHMVATPQVRLLEIEKEGQGKNSAGNVRNKGMQHVETEWIAFVDDDDVISPDFVETFEREIGEHPSVDVLIFRMYDTLKRRIRPKLDARDIVRKQVGISFVIRTTIFQAGLKFIPSEFEDFEYLNRIRSNGFTLMISPYVRYFVDGGMDTDAHRWTGSSRVLDSNPDTAVMCKRSTTAILRSCRPCGGCLCFCEPCLRGALTRRVG